MVHNICIYYLKSSFRFMHMSVLHACVYMYYACFVLVEVRRGSEEGVPELELWMGVSYHEHSWS